MISLYVPKVLIVNRLYVGPDDIKSNIEEDIRVVTVTNYFNPLCKCTLQNYTADFNTH